MVVAISDFRAQYSEFSNSVVYTDNQVQIWLNVANTVLDECRWGDLFQTGVCLFVAHNLTLGRRNIQASQGGGVPGNGGLTNQKAVGRVSTSNDTESTTVKNGGPWNLTTYGSQLLWYAQMVGSGGVQITGPLAATGDYDYTYPLSLY